MNKFRILVFLILGVCFANILEAQKNVPMQIIRNGAASSGSTKVPARPWYITQQDYLLSFPPTIVDYELQLLDKDGNLVYADFIPAGMTQTTLPSTLEGEFELRLMTDAYYYRGLLVF